MSKQKSIARLPTSQPCCDLAGILPPQFFKALADPNRIALLARLARCARPCTVTELSACCPIDLSVTSRHLALLRDAGIIHAQRSGRQIRYTVRFREIAAALKTMAASLQSCCSPRTTRKKGARK